MVSVSRILTFAFRHLVISEASCYSCSSGDSVSLYKQTWRVALSLVSVGRVFSAGKLSSYREDNPDIWCSNLPPDRSCVLLTKGLKIPWRVLWVAGGCQPTLCPSYHSAARTERGLCPYSDRVFASLTNAVSSPTRLDWSRCCVPLTRSPKNAW